jgi:uncharacterized protein (DUF1499 family)
MTPTLGPVDGRLRACPDSPNCVSSQAQDAGHRVDPLPAGSDPAAALPGLRAVIEGMPRTQIVSAEGDYLHATFTSALFRFVDDVELLLDRGAGVVHVRSASRIGYSDLGANRKRVEAIRQAWRP